MAKFGFDERRLFFISEAAMENLSGTPSDSASGQMLVYIKSDHLYIKKPTVGEVLIVENGTNLGSATANPDGADVFVQKNTSAELEFRRLISSTGTVNFDSATDSNLIDINVDLGDINDELDHGALLGLSDDDHLQYLLLAGRSGGQVANGGTDASDDLELKSTANATKGEVKIVDGSDFRHGRRLMQESSASTTDATLTVVDTVPLNDDRCYNIIARVVARRSDATGSRASFQFQTTAYRESAGAATLQGSVKQEYKSSSAANLDANISVSGNNVQVEVTGIAAQDFEWCVYIDSIEGI